MDAGEPPARFVLRRSGSTRTTTPHYERCAFIYYTSRLRGQLSNCRGAVHPVPDRREGERNDREDHDPEEPDRRRLYWYGSELLGREPLRARTCVVDFAPNKFPDILHDLKPPAIEMTTTPLRTWQSSTSPDFCSRSRCSMSIRASIPGGSERHSYETTALERWSRPAGAAVTELRRSSASPATRFYRVVAVDKHGNVKVGPEQEGVRSGRRPRSRASRDVQRHDTRSGFESGGLRRHLDLARGRRLAPVRLHADGRSLQAVRVGRPRWE